MSQRLICTANDYLINKRLFFTVLKENCIFIDNYPLLTQTIGYDIYPSTLIK
ncbi:hypothetical protein AWOD_I_2245 [Aliivibrio wodanis]|uniref:Uncharacterized protein n=1 Tax=Aliivibrio wodanis TaxID=80852 RepID=A0A090KL92_9GAMM|nr:hypothetical protein AWOD_I_2245 [Aliivibrio wodanis]